MAAASGRREEFLFLHRTVLETISGLDNMLDPSQIDGVVLRLDCAKRYLVNISDDSQTDGIISQLQQVIDSLEEERHQYENREGHPMAAKLIKQTRGRPSFDIREETLTFLLEKGFKVPVIAQLLMVSARTVERRMNKYGLTVSG